MNQQLLKGTLKGVAAGLIATWVMTKAQTKVQAWEKALTDNDKKDKKSNQEEDPSTVQVANKISQSILHHPVSDEKKNSAGNVVHYAFGTATGALFGALIPKKTISFSTGLAYGTLVWVIADNIMVPLFGFSKSPTQYPLKTHLYAFGSHLVYGGTLGKIVKWEMGRSYH